MRLTNRDTEIISFIETNKGATIEQIQKMYFPSYDVAANRLKILSDNNFLKVQVHPVIGKKVYYLKKMPSFHSLVITEITIKFKDQIKFMQREYKIKNYFVDCIFILKSGTIIILEVDIFNRTKEQKIKDILQTLAATKTLIEIWIVCKHERRKRGKGDIKYIKIEKIKNISLNTK